jgi:hypothetical protein
MISLGPNLEDPAMREAVDLLEKHFRQIFDVVKLRAARDAQLRRLVCPDVHQ